MFNGFGIFLANFKISQYLCWHMKEKMLRLEPANPRMSVGEVREWCYDELLSHYPVTEGGLFLGMIRCEDLEQIDGNEPLSKQRYLLENIFVPDNINDWTQLFSNFLSNETNVLPVIDQNRHYLGVYLLEDLLEELSEIKAFSSNGTVIRISGNTDDFSFSQVAQIIEATGGKLLGILLVDENANELIADVKIKSENINEILQTFRRYDYTILSEHPEDKHLQELRENANYLEKYLRMGE